MKDEHKIAFIAIGYGIVLSVVTYIFYSDFVTWAMLGALTALFNHSQMLQITKGNHVKINQLATHLVTRFLLYVIMIVIAFFQLRESQDALITAYIILLLGFSSIKISTWIYALPIFKKTSTETKDEA
ncbi:MAG TPA: hypothetical protein DC003_02115 [Acholeplasmataceae bacterium]|nr:hypothetical protein [Acholeplasmataceae bacterium]